MISLLAITDKFGNKFSPFLLKNKIIWLEFSSKTDTNIINTTRFKGNNLFMNFYELTFIVRQDMSSSELDKITESFVAIIESFGCNVPINEYWGLKNLAYEISNNKKGHYVFLGIEMNKECMDELERKIKLSEHVIRYLILKVDQIVPTPEQMFKNSNAEIGAINVTN